MQLSGGKGEHARDCGVKILKKKKQDYNRDKRQRELLAEPHRMNFDSK